MRAVDTAAAGTLLFMLLVAAASADECLGSCVGTYMCGFGFCYCPGAATKSSCPDPCIFSASGSCPDDDDSNGSDGNELSAGATAGIVVAAIVATAAVVGVVIYAIRKRKPQSEPPRTRGFPALLQLAGWEPPPPQDKPPAKLPALLQLTGWNKPHKAATANSEQSPHHSNRSLQVASPATTSSSVEIPVASPVATSSSVEIPVASPVATTSSNEIPVASPVTTSSPKIDP